MDMSDKSNGWRKRSIRSARLSPSTSLFPSSGPWWCTLSAPCLLWHGRRAVDKASQQNLREEKKKERHWRGVKAGAEQTNEKARDLQRSPGLAGRNVTQDRKYHAQAVARGKSPGSIKTDGICLCSGNPEVCSTRTKCDYTVVLICPNGPIIMVPHSVIRVGLVSLT